MATVRFPGLAYKIFDAGVVKFGAFRLKKDEGKPEGTYTPSPFYLNFRPPPKGPLDDVLTRELGEALWRLTKTLDLRYTSVVGVPEAGNPFAKVIAELADVPQVFLCKEESEGRRRVTINRGYRFPTGTEQVLLVDDLVTEAHSKLEAASAIKSAGGEVRDVVVFVDREQGGREVLAQGGFNLHTLWKITDLLDFYVNSGLLSYTKYWEVRKYIRENRA